MQTINHSFRTAALCTLILSTGLLGACGGGRSSQVGEVPSPNVGGSQTEISLHVLSNRADLISAGDALVEVLGVSGSAGGSTDISSSGLGITLNGLDISDQFAWRENGRVMARIEGLRLGDNVLSLHVDGTQQDAITITNHPNGGPVFAGPQAQPWSCGNDTAAGDAWCNQSPEYSYFYKSSNPVLTDLQPYELENPPADVAITTTDQGVTLPFIVRRELGYQDRDQYKIFMLFNPEEAWEPWAPQVQWNHKLLITHGGSCGVSYASGEAPEGDQPGTGNTAGKEQAYITALGRGFSVASTALNNLGHNCNIVTAAESLIMLKEYLIEQYGELRYTLGTGCSGGSITEQSVANAYPGVYQGLIAACSYPDVMSTALQFADYHLLRVYFENPGNWGMPWTPNQFAAVEGHVTHANAVAADELFFKAATNPSNPACNGVEAGSGADKLYDASSNPGGVRCGVLDYVLNVLGPREPDRWSADEVALGRGFAGLPLTNIGVQYGLQALQNGDILPGQFVDLNEKIGSFDIDFKVIPSRNKADAQAVRNIYRSGNINLATNLNKVAIIDGRGADPGIAHDAVHVYMLRARFDEVHGHHDSHVIWQGPNGLVGDSKFWVNALLAMDRWIAAVETDERKVPLEQKIVDNKPADIGDACYDGQGNKLSDGECPEGVVPVYATPRIVAGDSLTAETSQCELKPLDRNDDYGALGLSDDEWTRLQAVFPDGVCDYSQPPVGYQHVESWLSYQDVIGDVIYGGTAMPPAPRNSGSGWAAAAFGVFQ